MVLVESEKKIRTGLKNKSGSSTVWVREMGTQMLGERNLEIVGSDTSKKIAVLRAKNP